MKADLSGLRKEHSLIKCCLVSEDTEHNLHVGST